MDWIHCPTCGSYCCVEETEEGTHYFVPTEQEMITEIALLKRQVVILEKIQAATEHDESKFREKPIEEITKNV